MGMVFTIKGYWKRNYTCKNKFVLFAMTIASHLTLDIFADKTNYSFVIGIKLDFFHG